MSRGTAASGTAGSGTASGTPASRSSGQMQTLGVRTIFKSRRGHVSGLEGDRIAHGSRAERVGRRHSPRLLTSGMHLVFLTKPKAYHGQPNGNPGLAPKTTRTVAYGGWYAPVRPFMCCLGECESGVQFTTTVHLTLSTHRCWPDVTADSYPSGTPAGSSAGRHTTVPLSGDAACTTTCSFYNVQGHSHQLGHVSDQPRGSGTHTTPRQTPLDFQKR